MTNTILPKSLHTVTVLANVAEIYVSLNHTPKAAIKAALVQLGYTNTPDPYGLADKALAVLQKRLDK